MNLKEKYTYKRRKIHEIYKDNEGWNCDNDKEITIIIIVIIVMTDDNSNDNDNNVNNYVSTDKLYKKKT